MKDCTIHGMRRNFDKPDYQWIYKYTNGSPVVMTEEQAQNKIDSILRDNTMSLYDLRIVKIGELGFLDE